MIRPFTLICMASAFGAGLYLYQSKHTAQVLDREITRTLKQTETTRDRTGMLRAEWALLNEPDRLAELAKAHLSLQTLKPTQFAAMSDLGSRLPAPVEAQRETFPAEPEPEEVPVAQATPAAAPVAVAAVPPTAASSKARDVASAAEPKKVEAKPEPKSEPKQVAEARPAPKPVERPVVAHAEPARSGEMVAQARSRSFAPSASSNEATAPGTVGAAVMRAMRARAAEEGQAQNQAPTRGYAAPVYAQPVSNVPSYARPNYPQSNYPQSGYPQPSYAQPAYAQPAATSVLGGRSALPPPVPYMAR